MADEQTDKAGANLAAFRAGKPLLATFLDMRQAFSEAGIKAPAIQVQSADDFKWLARAVNAEMGVRPDVFRAEVGETYFKIFGISVYPPKLGADAIPCPTCGGTDYALSEQYKRVLAS